MCGIAGIAGRNNAVEQVQSMLQYLHHRGPDGEGVWSPHDTLALGHRRLAINDLSSAGKQPMVAAEGDLAIIVNGEIYNYPELRKQLESKGYRFRSNSDSEIVLHAWKAWGKECFIRFNGMFAIGLYDSNLDQLVIARDRLGIKPLYYSESKGGFSFASEIKALNAGLKFDSTTIDPIGLNQYLAYQNYFGERTIQRDVKLLQPGHLIIYKPGLKPESQPYWSLSFEQENQSVKFDVAIEQYRQTLDDSISRHLMSDVPVASYLSAGFDSATVANRAAAIGQPPVCFTGTFEEGGWYDETTIAREMADHNKSQHVPVKITAYDLPRVMDTLVQALDEPRMGMGAFPQYCMAERVAETHKVILTGHGGDELFSGYPVFKLIHYFQMLRNAPFNAISQLNTLRVSELPHLIYFSLSAFKSQRYKQYLPVLNSVSNLQSGLKKEWGDSIRDLKAEDELLALDISCRDQMQILFSHYLKAYLNGLLIVEDKLSMAHSLESRTPMLDNAMLDLSLSFSQNVKLYDGVLKAVIKEGGRIWLPDSLYQQPKRGFPTPLRYWLRNELRSWFKERIYGIDSGLRQLFCDSWLKSQCNSYLNSPRRKIRVFDEIESHRMWQLLSLESWLRQR